MDAFIARAVASNSTPRKTEGGQIILREGRNSRILVDSNGDVTAAGRAYEARTGEQLPRGGMDKNQKPYRRGPAEFIEVLGEEKLARTYDPVTNDWRYTAAGEKGLQRSET